MMDHQQPNVIEISHSYAVYIHLVTEDVAKGTFLLFSSPSHPCSSPLCAEACCESQSAQSIKSAPCNLNLKQE